MRRNEMFTPVGASGGPSRLACSRSEVVSLAASALLLVPLLLLVGSAFSLPSLFGRGVESLIPRHSDGTASRQPAVPARPSVPLVRPERPRPASGSVLPPRIHHRPSLGAASSAPARATPVAASGGSRSTPAREHGVTEAPTTGGSRSTKAPAPGGGSRPPDPADPGRAVSRPPAVSVGVTGTTATVGVDTGSPVPVTATVSVAPSSVSADVSVAGNTAAAGATAETDLSALSPPAVTATVAAPVVATAVALLGG